MKLYKKIALLGLASLTALSLGVLSACVDTSNSSTGDESSSNSSAEEEIKDFVYRIKVQNETGYGFKNLPVSLYDGETKIAEATTNRSGYATFTKNNVPTVGNYTIRTETPLGYALADPAVTPTVVALEGYETEVVIAPTGILEGKAPAGTIYSLGDVVYDFTVTTSDGEKFTLSEVLEEKELVLLNFWATWCGPCKSEFPAMNNAYVAYQESVEVLAISTTDSMQAVREFKSQNGLQFKMTSNSDCGADIVSMFPSSGIPLSVMIDRYGAITYYHTGSMTDAKDFTVRFDKFLGVNYQPTIMEGAGNVDGDNGGSNDNNLIKPTVTAPSLDEVKEVLAKGSNDFTFSWDEDDEYAWPWLVEDDYLYSPIATQSLHGNYSTLRATFTAAPGDAVRFSYVVNSEITDILYVLVDGVPVQQLSGGNNDLIWNEVSGGYYFKEGYDEEGEHEIIFLYLKDGDVSVDRESARIKDLTLIKDAKESDLKLLNFRHAANIENTDKNATTMYKYYADVKLSDADGYYHVGSKDGPILYANMMFESRWSDTSVWMLSYYGYIVSEGYNFSADIEYHAWAASQYIPGFEQLYGYVPVTEELKELLVYATKSEAIADEELKNWSGAWHDKEWLEMCAYYDNHGVEPLADHMETITFHAAKEAQLGENKANILYDMVPRGFKYKFTPEVSSVYRVYSAADNVNTDPVCFYFGASTTEYAFYDAPDDYSDTNFDFYLYLEAGKTYYFAMATYSTFTGSYPFYIEKIEGSYSYMHNCATSISFNEITNKMFLYDGIEYEKGEDGYYHVKNEDGTLGSVIYVDLLRTTVFFQDNSLYDIAVAGLLNYTEEKRAFYIDGVDYSERIAQLGHQSHFAEREGFLALDQELFDILKTITESEKYDGVPDSWQLLCYYEVTLGA